ncbi:MAG: hypothetical protein NT022_09735, partial [Deltaproteobacteria bacterium]|nr:hypothetical protein [Deltaproteobacteria bacterium]
LHAAVGNIDDYEDVAVGTEKVLGDFENLESFAPGVAKQAKAEALRDIGTVARDYGDDVAKSTMNGITREVIQVDKVSPKDLGDYITAVEKIPGAVDPIEDTGKQGLVKMMNSPSTRTLVKDDSGKIIKEIDNVAVLKNGEHYFDQVKQKWSGFGWLHIYLPRNQVQSHANDIMDALNLVDNDAAVKDVISEILETGEVNHIPGNAYEITKTVTRNGQSHDILVVISDDPKNIGSLQDAYPI